MRTLALAFALLLLALPAGAADDGFYRFGASHSMDFSSTSTEMTSGVGAQTRLVRLLCTTDCWVAVAVSGQTAGAVVKGSTSALLPADVPEYAIISPNSKVGVVRDASDGTINIIELSK